MAVLLDQAGSALLDQAGLDLLDQLGLPAFPVSVMHLSRFNVLRNVSASETSAWNVGQGYQQSMVQMASVSWISTIPS